MADKQEDNMTSYINQSEIKYQENKKKREKQTGLSSNQYFNKAEYQYKLKQASSLLEQNPTIVDDIDARMNQFTADYDSFFKGYKTAETAQEQANKLKMQADDLNKLFADYGIIFDSDYVSNVTNFLNSTYETIDTGVVIIESLKQKRNIMQINV